MQALIENLYDNNVLFSYYGFIDNSVLEQVLQITKSKLESNKESAIVVARVYDTIKECVENIIEHNFLPDEAFLNYKSLLLISQNEKSYSIDTINVVNARQKASIALQLEALHSKSKDELRTLKSEIETSNKISSKPEGAGLGLINLILKADKCEYRFMEYKSDFLFNSNFQVGSQQHSMLIN